MTWVTEIDLGSYCNASNNEVVKLSVEKIKVWAKNNKNVIEVSIMHNATKTNNAKKGRVLFVKTPYKFYTYKMVVIQRPSSDDITKYYSTDTDFTGRIWLQRFNTISIGSDNVEKIYEKEQTHD